jgi:magnesium transporter
MERTASYLLYRIIDELATEYGVKLEEVESVLDDLEEQLFNESTRQTPKELFDLKRIVLQLRRIAGDHRDVLSRLGRDSYPVVTERDRPYFRDIYDHFDRMMDHSETLRDLVMASLETYLSIVNNRMNDIMKTLTIITTIFMPLTFVTGFFGMNFFGPEDHPAGWTSQPAFVAVMLLTLLIPGIMFAWMRRRAWM